MVRTLLAANADPEGGDGGTAGFRPLHAACRAGERDVVEALLETWVDTDAAPRKGRRLLRPLHVAAVHGNAAVVEALTLKGCRLDVRTLDPSRWAVLLRVCVGGCLAWIAGGKTGRRGGGGYIPYNTLDNTPPRTFFQARFLDSEEYANAERCVHVRSRRALSSCVPPICMTWWAKKKRPRMCVDVHVILRVTLYVLVFGTICRLCRFGSLLPGVNVAALLALVFCGSRSCRIPHAQALFLHSKSLASFCA